MNMGIVELITILSFGMTCFRIGYKLGRDSRLKK